MIVDLRTYRIKPGKMPQELKLYAKRGPGGPKLGAPALHGQRGAYVTRRNRCRK